MAAEAWALGHGGNRLVARAAGVREATVSLGVDVYDVTANAGWVNVGTDHDTAAFAVESIRRWWNARGQASYPAAR